MAKIIGRFYFKQTKSGNLIGEFSNNGSKANETESANLKTIYSEEFIGTYNSCWGDIGEITPAELIITHKFSPIDNIYTLLWNDEKGNEIFWGEGFVIDEMLIGDYRNFKNVPV